MADQGALETHFKQANELWIPSHDNPLVLTKNIAHSHSAAKKLALAAVPLAGISFMFSEAGKPWLAGATAAASAGCLLVGGLDAWRESTVGRDNEHLYVIREFGEDKLVYRRVHAPAKDKTPEKPIELSQKDIRLAEKIQAKYEESGDDAGYNLFESSAPVIHKDQEELILGRLEIIRHDDMIHIHCHTRKKMIRVGALLSLSKEQLDSLENHLNQLNEHFAPRVVDFQEARTRLRVSGSGAAPDIAPETT